MEGLWEALMSAVVKLLTWFKDVFVSIFKAGWDFLTDAVCWAFDGLLSIVVTAVNSVDVSGLQGYGSAAATMPAEIINIMQLAGLGTAAQIVIAAIGIRLVLQLIPFTRLGS